MSTITSKSIINDLIENHGYYMDDPRVFMIVEYTSFSGEKCWGVTWENEPPARRERYLIETQYVNNPKVVWRQ